MSTLRVAGAMCAALMALAGIPAQALDAHTALAQYGYQSWQTDTGLPQNTVHAIVQGRGGFLWIATEGGLVRFDGVDFRTYTRANTPGLPSDLIDDLMEDRAGGLWDQHVRRARAMQGTRLRRSDRRRGFRRPRCGGRSRTKADACGR